MSDPNQNMDSLIKRLDRLIELVSASLPGQVKDINWQQTSVARWRIQQNGQGFFEAVSRLPTIQLRDLQEIDDQKQRLYHNTQQFVLGRGANNVLLTGARGTGKSSLIKAVVNEFKQQGLRLIEVDKEHLLDLPDIVDALAPHPQRFIIFCDDLSFEANESGYKMLKTVLDGSVSETPQNVLIYATSNRRHLMPEFLSDNQEVSHLKGEIHPGETIEEKTSLSDRFGLWISFYPMDQEAYLTIATHWATALGAEKVNTEEFRMEALAWALMRGSRSGRSAWQFARDWSGRLS
ncbi:MAG: AAA family ATPase [Ferrovum sp. 37-45-19]|uniref:ATP-binding protein n=1 Tax=Ferrovum sp. JA12 TaxID=1356299 RepID=UPI000703A9FE|nr:ATP-binding protein [Ferrovum sp. JA12]OYV80657.1 MAG: AAA family ATPase [Ferrovum sp. 21-44-67]OYV95208.1 MAG: AAA family ATPase [Ferrovum sp. 37-45-19]HQT80710.1 ATP-binding protein [Ferrovaceae bacterium]KRH79803.1 ATPase family associated with various cellular activities (AAA) [Ferrovum sp. JA12]HQU05920.1 ATP-binding protein [Ferrovaceae bacterium]